MVRAAHCAAIQWFPLALARHRKALFRLLRMVPSLHYSPIFAKISFTPTTCVIFTYQMPRARVPTQCCGSCCPFQLLVFTAAITYVPTHHLTPHLPSQISHFIFFGITLARLLHGTCGLCSDNAGIITAIPLTKALVEAGDASKVCNALHIVINLITILIIAQFYIFLPTPISLSLSLSTPPHRALSRPEVPLPPPHPSLPSSLILLVPLSLACPPLPPHTHKRPSLISQTKRPTASKRKMI